MAQLLSRATGNFLTAATWALVDPTSFNNLAALDTNSTLLPNSSGASSRTPSGSTPGAITIDGIALKIAGRATTPTGTMTVSLFIASGAQVAGTSVTINVADLPASSQALSQSNENGWVFFKFSAPVTLSAATQYVVDAFTSTGSQVNLYRTVTTQDWVKMLRTTTTQVPVASDDFVVLGEHLANNTSITGTATSGSNVITSVSSFTDIAVGKSIAVATVTNFGASPFITAFDSGAGTITLSTPASGNNAGATLSVGGNGNNFTMTMDETAATDYGSTPTAANSLVQWCGVCKRGTLKWNDVSAANPKLRLSNALIVHRDGILNIGTTGTPIPRNSTAVLEFDCAADGDYGLIGRDGSTVIMQGLSRTSGKNVVQCKLTADAPATTNLIVGVAPTGTATAINPVTTTSDPTGISLGAFFNTATLFGTVNDSASNSTHFIRKTSTSIAGNTTQVFSVWLERGTGTNNRFVRMQVGDTIAVPSTNGFYADIDLQAGTIGTCTAIGNGTAGSASITPFGTGFICTIIGAVSSATTAPHCTLAAANALGGITYVGDATQNFRYYNMQLYTASALPSPDLTVDTDTGWLSGDVIAIASTTRTVSDCEPLALSSNAGASSLPLKLAVVVPHSGTSPTQAEIINITRNVKVRSTSATIMAYVNFKALCSVDIDWVEFYWLGEAAAGKRGIEVDASSGVAAARSVQFCSLHDCEDFGFYCGTGGNSLNLVFSNNVGWLCASVTGPAWTVATAITLTDWTFDNNILIRTLASNGWTLTDVGGMFTNNTVAGATSVGAAFSETSGQVGTASGNIAHSNGANGFIGASALSGTIGSTVAWRNNAPGFSPGAAVDLILDGVVLFGNVTDNMQINGDIVLKNPVFNGDTTFPTLNGIRQASVGAARLVIDGGDFSTVSGIKTAHNADINMGSGGSTPQIILRNTKLGASNEVTNQNLMGNNGFVASSKHDQIAGNHKTWLQNGTIQTDTTIFKTASPSLRMTPIATSFTFTGTTANTTQAVTGITALTVGWVPRVGDRVTGIGIADGTTLTAVDLFAGTATLSVAATLTGSRTFALAKKLESAPQFQGTKVAVAPGASVGISVWARKSVVGDGAAYDGAQPRLILKANPAIGIAADVVLDTVTVAAGTWEQMTGTTATATDDGVMEFVVDADGSAGFVNLDDWTVP